MTSIDFQDLPLSKDLLNAIADMGFQKASAIQAQAIPYLLEGRDLIGQAQTGTGKTAAFAIPMIERIEAGKRQLQGMVICPTRELAIQVAEEYRKLLKYRKNVSVVAVYGGDPIVKQFRALQQKPQIVVGTPGRILDHLRRGTIDVSAASIVVLDEADKMLDMGFKEDIETILQNVPPARQTVLFSATMPRAILQLTKNYQQNPQIIKIAQQAQDLKLIEQSYVEIPSKKKLSALKYLIDLHQLKLAVVFCNTKLQVDELVSGLQNAGYMAGGLHGGMPQPKRDRMMNLFRKGGVQLLVATNVAARGLDVRNIDAVVNYDLPHDKEEYVHRVGRTGRAGNSGKAISFVEKGQSHSLRMIKHFANINLFCEEIPILA